MKSRPPRPAPRSQPKGGPPRPRPAGLPSGGPRAYAGKPVGRFSPPREADFDDSVRVAPPEVLAEAASSVAAVVEPAVLNDGLRADKLIAEALKKRRDLAAPDHRFVAQAVFALFRWRGWVEPLGDRPLGERLMLSCLLDSPTVPAACRVWARQAGKDPSSLSALGGAPTWAAKSESFRRLVGYETAVADPWRLFPAWLRDHLPTPPGEGTPKAKFMAFLQAMQARPPLWVRIQGVEPEKLWAELKALSVRPLIYRKLGTAAKIAEEVDVYHLPPFERGQMEIQDLASQAVALACDPDPGDRWWDCCAGAGGKALHLSALMQGKGLVVATDVQESKLKEVVRRARKSPFRNLTTKPWDGKHVVGKASSYDGVLVDAPCTGIGTWRRNPEARWTLDRDAVGRLSGQQAQILRVAAGGVKVGGTLVYAVCTITPAETTGVVDGFLAAHPHFRPEPFPHPLTGARTEGTATIWPMDADTDGMFIARMVRAS